MARLGLRTARAFHRIALWLLATPVFQARGVGVRPGVAAPASAPHTSCRHRGGGGAVQCVATLGGEVAARRGLNTCVSGGGVAPGMCSAPGIPTCHRVR